MADTDPDDLRNPTLSLSEIVAILRRRWRWFVGGTVVVTLLALSLSLSQPSQYQADARVLIPTSTATDDLGQAGEGDAFVADRQLKNEAQVLVSSALRAEVDAAYEGDIDVNDVAASPNTDGSDTVDITVTGEDPDDAAALALLYAETYITFSQERRIAAIEVRLAELEAAVESQRQRRAEVAVPLNAAEAAVLADPNDEAARAAYSAQLGLVGPQLSQIDQTITTNLQLIQSLQISASLSGEQSAQLIAEPEVPTTPIAPSPVRDAVIGLLLGLGIGFGLALAREFLDDSVRTPDDLARLGDLQVPLLGTVPSYRDVEDEIVAEVHPTSGAAEAYRAVRTSVRLLAIDRPMKLLQLTSTNSGEGKSTTIANLACSLVQAGHRVAVVSCDLRRPHLHRRFQVPSSPGLTNVLLGECNLGDALRTTSSGVVLLTAGSRPPNPSELLGSSRTATVFEVLAGQFDFVLIDTPPVLSVTDAVVVSRLVDATLVVLGAGATSRKRVRQTFFQLEQVNAPVVGMVLNKVRAGGREGYDYQYAESST